MNSGKKMKKPSACCAALLFPRLIVLELDDLFLHVTNVLVDEISISKDDEDTIKLNQLGPFINPSVLSCPVLLQCSYVWKTIVRSKTSTVNPRTRPKFCQV